MSSIRYIKKDVKAVVNHIKQECYASLNYAHPLYYEKIYELMLEAQELEEEFVKKTISCPSQFTSKEKKQYFKNLIKELMEKTVNLVDYLASAES
ncbi:MAG TPA: hypothetical protein VMW01_03000 [Williamwhitmania sp.]|jgi:replicative DNA helicase|nr:hypothetical protein [Williamwhitmania sp.]